MKSKNWIATRVILYANIPSPITAQSPETKTSWPSETPKTKCAIAGNASSPKLGWIGMNSFDAITYSMRSRTMIDMVKLKFSRVRVRAVWKDGRKVWIA